MNEEELVEKLGNLGGKDFSELEELESEIESCKKDKVSEMEEIIKFFDRFLDRVEEAKQHRYEETKFYDLGEFIKNQFSENSEDMKKLYELIETILISQFNEQKDTLTDRKIGSLYVSNGRISIHKTKRTKPSTENIRESLSEFNLEDDTESKIREALEIERDREFKEVIAESGDLKIEISPSENNRKTTNRRIKHTPVLKDSWDIHRISKKSLPYMKSNEEDVLDVMKEAKNHLTKVSKKINHHIEDLEEVVE